MFLHLYKHFDKCCCLSRFFVVLLLYYSLYANLITSDSTCMTPTPRTPFNNNRGCIYLLCLRFSIVGKLLQRVKPTSTAPAAAPLVTPAPPNEESESARVSDAFLRRSLLGYQRFMFLLAKWPRCAFTFTIFAQAYARTPTQPSARSQKSY